MLKSDTRMLEDLTQTTETVSTRKPWKAPRRTRLETEETRGGLSTMSEVFGFMT